MSGALLYIKGFINKCAANVNEQQISLTRSSADGGTFLTRIGRCANENQQNIPRPRHTRQEIMR